jgi:uncharacterized protein (TIGR03118 family)
MESMVGRREEMRRSLLFVIFAVSAPAIPAASIGFTIVGIASDQLGVATITDPNLVNAWGLISSPTSPWWIGDNGTGTSVLYNGATQTKIGLVVTIPGDGTVTGVAFNGNAAAFNGDNFLFASEDGTVSGWRGSLGTAAQTLQAGSADNVYKGITDALVGGDTYAYLANFRTGNVDVLAGSAGAPALTGTFTDPTLPAGYAPFNVMRLGGAIYVTYAVQDGTKHDEVAAPGNGIVDAYDLNGNLISRLVTGGQLNAPWGLALAPANFPGFGGDLLVGNFGDGTINAYDPLSGAYQGTLEDPNGNPLFIDGLWGLQFGNGASAGPSNQLFFTAGPDGEAHGLFGTLDAVPEPATWLLSGAALALLWRRRGNATAPRA